MNLYNDLPKLEDEKPIYVRIDGETEEQFIERHELDYASKAVNVPLLANITEFGQTPLFSVEELRSSGVGMVLYPLSAFRAMNKAAETIYTAIRRDGHQRNVIDLMQTRDELYDRINYHEFEGKLDALFAQGKSK